MECLPISRCRCRKVADWWPFPKVRTRSEGMHASIWGSTIAKVQGGRSCLDELEVILTTRNASKVKILGLNLHPFNFAF